MYSGTIRAFNNTNGVHLRRNNPGDSGNAGDFEVGDVITTQLQEDSIHAIGSDLFNSTPTDGWYVSNIETNKEKGSLPEFIEKEGKWFNYIKGIDQRVFKGQTEIMDFEDFDFGSFDVQGLGMIESIDNNDITINGDLNASLQVGDALYFERPSEVLGNNIVDTNGNTFKAVGFTIVSSDTVSWDGSIGTVLSLPAMEYPVLDVTRYEDTIIGKKYRLTLDIMNYSGTGEVGVRTHGGVSGSARMAGDDSSNYSVSGASGTGFDPSSQSAAGESINGEFVPFNN